MAQNQKALFSISFFFLNPGEHFAMFSDLYIITPRFLSFSILLQWAKKHRLQFTSGTIHNLWKYTCIYAIHAPPIQDEPNWF